MAEGLRDRCRWLDKYLHDSRPALLVDWRAEALFIDNYGSAYKADCLGPGPGGEKAPEVGRY